VVVEEKVAVAVGSATMSWLHWKLSLFVYSSLLLFGAQINHGRSGDGSTILEVIIVQ
jgi:hypothetical protein